MKRKVIAAFCIGAALMICGCEEGKTGNGQTSQQQTQEASEAKSSEAEESSAAKESSQESAESSEAVKESGESRASESSEAESSDAGSTETVEESIKTENTEETEENGSESTEETAESGEESTEEEEGETIRVIWDEEMDLSTLGAYDEISVTGSDYSTKVVFTAKETVKDFKILALTYRDVDESGNIIFDVEEMETRRELTPERPLVVEVAFFGSIPNNGISYVDVDGTTKRFALDMSGMDGSVYLWEF